ncbi:hypothetical protein [Pectobacterium atrosepticum]|uniref:hypothetical protein n=1 Tax=Pectobacterium atrosepticum TaxID=29471 RepID=UPI000CDD72C8|nr:hypothetical protein [Pectobacterium atrosepticum]POW23577.1 hypothetical protein PB72LOC_04491 [Pectobacterium atrosepticum]
MAKYRVSFKMIKYSAGGSKSTAITSETVEAETETTAIQIATNKAKTKSAYRDYECNLDKVVKIK